nr:hypothetical protein CFP56_36829 [Quercus suber]
MMDNYTAKRIALVRISERHKAHTRKLNVKLHEDAKKDFLVAFSHFVKWSTTIAAYLRDANNIVSETEDVKVAEIIINVHNLFPLTRTINWRIISDRLSREIKKLLEGANIAFAEII